MKFYFFLSRIFAFFFYPFWICFRLFFFDFLNFFGFFLDFLIFLDFFSTFGFFWNCVIFLWFFGSPFKATKVVTKSYQGYYWAPKIAKKGPKEHNKLLLQAMVVKGYHVFLLLVACQIQKPIIDSSFLSFFSSPFEIRKNSFN